MSPVLGLRSLTPAVHVSHMHTIGAQHCSTSCFHQGSSFSYSSVCTCGNFAATFRLFRQLLWQQWLLICRMRQFHVSTWLLRNRCFGEIRSLWVAKHCIIIMLIDVVLVYGQNSTWSSWFCLLVVQYVYNI